MKFLLILNIVIYGLFGDASSQQIEGYNTLAECQKARLEWLEIAANRSTWGIKSSYCLQGDK